MSTYCKSCKLPFEGERCPVCGRKSKWEIKPDDVCFLVEKEQIWSGMLADVLKQENIPYVTKNVLGAGLAIKVGYMNERVRFYVMYQHLEKAREITEELFSRPDSDDDCDDEDEDVEIMELLREDDFCEIIMLEEEGDL